MGRLGGLLVTYQARAGAGAAGYSQDPPGAVETLKGHFVRGSLWPPFNLNNLLGSRLTKPD